MSGAVSWEALILLASFAVVIAYFVWRICETLARIQERLIRLETEVRRRLGE